MNRSVEVLFLGSGDAFGSGGRFQTCISIRTPLDGLDIAIFWDSPQHMIAGGWTEMFFVGGQANPAQREALETIFSGKAGGPWEVLARFVARRLPTRYVPLPFEDGGRRKMMVAEGLFDMAVEAIRGKDKAREAFRGGPRRIWAVDACWMNRVGRCRGSGILWRPCPVYGVRNRKPTLGERS